MKSLKRTTAALATLGLAAGLTTAVSAGLGTPAGAVPSLPADPQQYAVSTDTDQHSAGLPAAGAAGWQRLSSAKLTAATNGNRRTAALIVLAQKPGDGDQLTVEFGFGVRQGGACVTTRTFTETVKTLGQQSFELGGQWPAADDPSTWNCAFARLLPAAGGAAYDEVTGTLAPLTAQTDMWIGFEVKQVSVPRGRWVKIPFTYWSNDPGTPIPLDVKVTASGTKVQTRATRTKIVRHGYDDQSGLKRFGFIKIKARGTGLRKVTVRATPANGPAVRTSVRVTTQRAGITLRPGRYEAKKRKNLSFRVTKKGRITHLKGRLWDKSGGSGMPFSGRYSFPNMRLSKTGWSLRTSSTKRDLQRVAVINATGRTSAVFSGMVDVDYSYVYQRGLARRVGR